MNVNGWTTWSIGAQSGRTWRWTPGWQCDGPKVLVTIPETEGDGHELLLALEPVLERILSERLGDTPKALPDPFVRTLIPPGEPARAPHRCELPGETATARRLTETPGARPAELVYLGALVRCPCGQHWACEAHGDAWWVPVSRRQAERMMRRLERGQR